MTDRGSIGFPALGTLRARRLFDAIALRIAPGLAAAMVALHHRETAMLGLVVITVTLAAGQAVSRSVYPLHLLSLGGVAMRAAPPALGVGAAAAIAALDGMPLAAGRTIVVLLASWLVLALGLWLVRRFDTRREVRLAVIGPHEIAVSLSAELKAAGVRGYRVCGWLSTEPSAEGDAPRHEGPKRQAGSFLGSLDSVRSAVLENGIELLVNGPDPNRQVDDKKVFASVADACLDLPVRMIGGERFYEDLFGHVPLGTIDSAWFQSILHPAHRPQSSLSKRALDICLGSIAMVFAAPVLAVAALAIKITDGGPVFYRQRRMGEGGREFRMLKLRTMRIDAEGNGGARLTVEDDERVTPVGRLLRRSHVDELPQLFNVLRGEMALVGPRPERGELVSKLETEYRYFDRRHLIKPGITGWAQVTCGYAGSDAGVAWKLCHDLFYLKHRSMLADLLILTETVRTVFADVQYGLPMPDERFIVGGATT